MPYVPENGHANMIEGVLSLWDSITLGTAPELCSKTAQRG